METEKREERRKLSWMVRNVAIRFSLYMA